MSSSFSAASSVPTSIHRLRAELLERNRIELIRNHSIYFLFLLAFVLVPILSIAIDTPEVMVGWVVLIGIVCVTGAVAIIFVVRRELRKLEHLYLSYELTIDEGGIRRYQADTEPFVCEWRDVTRAEVIKGKGTRLLTGKFASFVWIPDELENYETALAAIHMRCPMENKAGLPFYLRQNINGFLYLLLIYSALTLENKLAATFVSAITVAVIVFAVVHTLRTPNATTTIRRSMVWFLLPVAIMLYRLWTLWFR
jgi:uncharacterized membrane protein